MPHKRIFVEEGFRRRIVEPDRLTGNKIRTIESEQAATAVREQGNDWTERISGLQVHNRRQALSLHHSLERPIGLERQKVDSAHNKPLPCIKVGTSTLCLEIADVLNLRIAAADGIRIDGLGKRVRRIE